MTPSEKLLWKYLSDRGMVGVKFRRQHPISGFILDFFCPTHNLAIELDGAIHANRVEYDREREQVLRSLGIKVLRFKNEQVINSLDSVLKTIKRTIFPSPLKMERGAATQSRRGEEGNGQGKN